MTNVESMDYTQSHPSTFVSLSNTAHLSSVSYTHNIPSSKQPPYCRCGTTPMGSQESLLRLPGRGVARRAGLVDSTGFYPGSGPLDGGKTLHPAFGYIDMGVVRSTRIYHEIVVMNMRLSID